MRGQLISAAIDRIRARWGQTQAVELALVAGGQKPSCRIKIERGRLGEFSATAADLSVRIVVGNDCVVGTTVPGRAGFTEWCTRAPLRSSNRLYSYVYVAPSDTAAQRLRRADEAEDDGEVGKLLGYPDCCIQGFDACARHAGAADPVLCNYLDVRPIHYLLNVSLLCFDVSAIFHVPCSAACCHSLDQAREYVAVLSNMNPIIATQITSALSTWVFHTTQFGVMSFSAKRREELLIVDAVRLVDPTSLLAELLLVGARITNTHDAIFLDAVGFSKADARLFRFKKPC